MSAATRGAARQIVDPTQLLLAGKAAVAASIAWYLAPLIPLADDEYSYYAPLGVLVSMYPTIAVSARAGLLALLGLATGVALGIGGLLAAKAGLPPLATLALVTGVGVLLGGLRALGTGRDWIAIAGLFVLVLGASDPDGFSTSYIVTMGFGVGVGVAVNILLAPPLRLQRAGGSLSVLRDEIVARLRHIADAVDAGDVDGDALAEAMAQLAHLEAQVADEVQEGDLSRRGNPRGLGRGPADQQRENARRLRAIERITFFTRDLADEIGRMRARESPLLEAEHRADLAEAIRVTTELVAQPPGAAEEPAKRDAAVRGVDGYAATLSSRLHGEPAESAAEFATVECLRRIIDAAAPSR